MDDFVTWHSAETFEALYSPDSAEKISTSRKHEEQDDIRNVITKNKAHA